MFKVIKKDIQWANQSFSVESGKIARQADGAVCVSYGETVVLATVVSNKEASQGIDFLPLTVQYQERMYSAGRIPGGFYKREGRASESETLISRLIDRPIRPLFPENYFYETQIIVTVLSCEKDNPCDIVGIIAAAGALAMSDVPVKDLLGAARVGYINGEYVLNPNRQQLEISQLDLVVAATRDGVLMVEAQAHELSEEQMLQAVVFGHEGIREILDLLEDFQKQGGVKKRELLDSSERVSFYYDKFSKYREDIEKSFQVKDKLSRQEALLEIHKAAIADVPEEDLCIAKKALKKLQSGILRHSLLNTKERIDGRALTDVRPIVAEVGFLPRVHGSALFTRGETQALVSVTLGGAQDEQIMDSIHGEYRERFLLHYNFPPFSVGETGRLGAPGRREIGHGKLAWRALQSVIPSKEEFPYSLRIVSEITESNGSSSMATVCGASLAFMDAGVPIKKPVAGIAMGLIQEGEECVVLSDILGDEDHLGDMDFKVAGTAQGITALQMDIKITSITQDIMKVALHQALEGRLHILKEMSKALSSPRIKLSKYVLKIVSFSIPVSKIKDVIGSGGKIIREIIEATGVTIDIADSGLVSIMAEREEQSLKAQEWIKSLVSEPEFGASYDAKVVSIVDFGVFVRFLGHHEGLVHISEICHERVEKVSDVLKMGQDVRVKYLGVDKRGKIKLSMKELLK